MYIVEQVQSFKSLYNTSIQNEGPRFTLSIGLRKATNVFGWGFVTFLPAKSTS